MVPVWKRTVVRRAVVALFAVTLPLSPIGCGTLLHPERIGQPRTGRLDTAVCVLDGVGCLLFVIPGVIALIVDYGTGALYLPPGVAATGDGVVDPATGLTRYELSSRTGSIDDLEAAIAARLGRSVDLDGPDTVVQRYDEFSAVPADVVRAQSPPAEATKATESD